MPRPHIVQAEFFLVDIGNGTLEHLLRECGDRRATGSPIKLTVRFFDEEWALTSLALEMQRLKEEQRKNFESFMQAGWFRRKFYSRCGQRLAGEKLAQWKFQRWMTVQQLTMAVRTSKPVAIEQSDHHFRLARENELHELLESAERSGKVWLFIFAYNDLCADSNQLVASAM